MRPVLSKIWINKESGFSHYIDVEDRIFSLKKRLWDGMIKKKREAWIGMGIYLNVGKDGFREAIMSKIYVDKTGLIDKTNKLLGTEQKYVCVSRPRRFGKSMAAQMLAAYYGKNNSRELFQGREIEREASFEIYLNKFNVIFLNMQEFLSATHDIVKMKRLIEKSVLWDLLEEYPNIRYFDSENLVRTLQDIYAKTQISFVFIIDEWDCIFRENRGNKEAQELYLDFLRNLLKDKSYVALAYMTGILPVKKYGTHSALNMFDEYSMTNPRQFAEYVGFTESEVETLCSQYGMDFVEAKRWYDGYRLTGLAGREFQIYSPRSVVNAMLAGVYDTYWNQTETFEALRDYIVLNYDGLKDTVITLIAGQHTKIETGTFTNDMTTFGSADDVMTLLIHLGYLGYDFSKKEVFIPNYEVSMEFANAVRSAGWDEVVYALKASEQLLRATWNGEEDIVAAGIEKAHFETSILNYNNENALSCTVSLAYYSAKRYYSIVREFPTGKGFADLVFLPRRNHMDKPAIVVELKWDGCVSGAIMQIRERKYLEALEDYKGKVLLVGINYDKESKTHECRIESCDW